MEPKGTINNRIMLFICTISGNIKIAGHPTSEMVINCASITFYMFHLFSHLLQIRLKILYLILSSYSLFH